MEAQEIVVKNKSQLLVAFECARDCPYPTIITLAKSRTVYYINGMAAYGSYYNSIENNALTKAKGRLRKTIASAIY